jgi:hypothetical protein
MANDIAKQARREADRLELELDTNPIFRKWKRAIALAEEYEAQAASIPVPISVPKAIASEIVKASGPTASERVQQAGIAFLRRHGRRAKAKEIYDAIKEQGLPIKGGDPIATVAAHMSNAKTLVNNVRGEGYGLKEWDADVPVLQLIQGGPAR